MGTIREVKNDQVRYLLSGEAGREEQRAAHLLLRHLNPKQRKSYLSKGEFVVRGSRRGRYVLVHDRYRVRWMPLWPIFPPLRFSGCIVPSGLGFRDWGHGLRVCTEYLPSADVLLALKLLLETDEKLFRKKTNWQAF